ncbi:MAG TPA: N-formylglutamate amidohydrolase [Polyangiaceae bacterium]|nr:N-formylglutamate amidohydrolase [Polyangiaceae bacterium]
MRSRSSRPSTALLFTCEHGGNSVPHRWAALFRGHEEALSSHRGYDIGAAEVAELMAAAFGAPLFVARASRLLVDLNRSPHHPRRFSEVTRALSRGEREHIEREHYTPHRAAVKDAIRAALRSSRSVVHVAVHSFTPVLGGVTRRADVGLLYDPSRKAERALSGAWQASLGRVAPAFVVRRNYPYRGAADGLTTALRKIHRASRYVGIELEMNQARLGSRRDQERMARVLVASLEAALG